MTKRIFTKHNMWRFLIIALIILELTITFVIFIVGGANNFVFYQEF